MNINIQLIFMPLRLCDNKNGFVMLISVLVIGAIAVSATLYLILSGLNLSQNSFALEQSNIAKSLANSCAETALNKIEMCSSTVGSFELLFDGKKCNYDIIDSGESEKTIESSAIEQDIFRKVKIVVDLNLSSFGISSWQEVASF